MTKENSKGRITVGALTACAIEVARTALVRSPKTGRGVGLWAPEWWEIEWKKEGDETRYTLTYKPGFAGPKKVLIVFPKSVWWEGYIERDTRRAVFTLDLGIMRGVLKKWEPIP